MKVDDVFTSRRAGCRLIIDQGLAPLDQVAGRGYAGRLSLLAGDRLGGQLWDEWEMVIWKQSLATVNAYRVVATHQQMPVGAAEREQVEAIDPLGVIDAGTALRDASLGVLQPFHPAPDPRLHFIVTHSEEPLFTVRKIDDGASLEFTRDPNQPVQDLGEALVFESGNVGGTFFRPILIAPFKPVWDF
jgi:hypothetical protein